jgi:phenylpropionate dioxygenase-like ring-hydroxylating dioxygenase large terminal subunit
MQREPGWDMADVHTPLLHDHWYVAGYADEFEGGLHERMFLGKSIVIYRKEDGELVALQNRCAHRSFPLAQGLREGDAIRCRYHGAKYDANGTMIEVPSMAGCPRVQLRRYPMRIAGPLAWIWMGEAGAEGELPDTSWLGEGWTFVTGAYPLKGNWLLMSENLMDLTHIPFLHASTFGFPTGFAQTPIKLEVQGDSLSFHRDNPPNYHRAGFLRPETQDKIEAAGFQARSTVVFVSPALTYGGGTFLLADASKADQPDYRWQVVHFTTPKSQGETHYWYFHARNYALDDAELSEKIRTLVVAGFEEDKVAIEQVQRMHDTDAHAYREVQFKSDAPAVAMRRIVAAMARRERDGGVGQAA